jgi:hypothetical protein
MLRVFLRDLLEHCQGGWPVSRSRNIKPGFFKNDLLAECHPLARILFAGLWCEADREGRLEDRPARIKAGCLPYDDCDVNGLLESLSKHDFITRYTVDGKNYVSINRFLTHQNPHKREVPSVIPAPSDAKHNLGSAESQPCTGSALLIPDSPFLIPDSLKKQKGGKPPALALPDWLPQSAWDDWHAFRNSRKGWTHKARELSLRTLTKLYAKGHDPTEIIEKSIEQGWTGLFEPRSETVAVRSQATSYGKTAQAIQALEDMKHGNRLGIGRDFDGHAEAHSVIAGKHAGS